MDRLLLVDGSNLLFQMFFGMPARIINSQGKAIQGTLGFVGALLKMIRMVQPTHVAVLFDGECGNPRRELDSNYKANREDFSQAEENDNPFSQLPDVYGALDYLGIFHQETEDCEADDWMAGYVRQYQQACQIVIASQDSDFFQLIGENVTVLRYRGQHSVQWDTAYLQQKLGIAPAQYALYKALTGDTADNIKGVPGIGPKTAAGLMNQFSTLQMLLDNAGNVEKPRIREAILSNAERIRSNYRLICLEGTQMLPAGLEKLRYEEKQMTTVQVLQGIGLR